MGNKELVIRLGDLACQFTDIVRLCRDYKNPSTGIGRYFVINELKRKYELIDQIISGSDYDHNHCQSYWYE